MTGAGGELLLPQAFRGFAQQFAVAPTVTLTLGGLAPERLKLASGLFNLMRNLGGAIGIAAVRHDPERPHQPAFPAARRASDHRQPSRRRIHRAHRGDRCAALGDAAQGRAAALKQLWALAWREAQTQTYADAFLAMMVCFIVATLMVPLMRKVAPPKGPAAAGH